MKTVFYTTIENQLREDGSYGLLYDHFDANRYGSEEAAFNAAKAKYFTVCAAAAVSGIPYHAVHLKNSEGYDVMQEINDRRPEQSDE